LCDDIVIVISDLLLLTLSYNSESSLDTYFQNESDTSIDFECILCGDWG
jgi:hypothetical protein